MKINTTTATTDPDRQVLVGASPDGLVTEEHHDHLLADGGNSNGTLSQNDSSDHSFDGLLEIKCLYGQRSKKKLKQYEYCPKRFYDQIQGQLAVCSGEGEEGTNYEWCDLIVWIPRNSKAKDQNYSIVRVYKNETYWNEKLLPEIKNFVTDVQTNVRNNKEKGEPK